MTAIDERAAGGGRPVARAPVRNRALALMSLALIFYFGFIAVIYFRHH